MEKYFISDAILRKAADKAHHDRMHSNHCGFIKKMDRQYRVFTDELIKRESEQKNSVCPYVAESELKNLPKDCFVIMDGTGRDFYGEITRRYSGRAGSKEQCLKFVEKYYDKYADWSHLPIVVSIDSYFTNYK